MNTTYGSPEPLPVEIPMSGLPTSEYLTRAHDLYIDHPKMHEAVAAIRDAQHRATLLSLTPEGDVMEAAIETGIRAAGNYLCCDGAVREGVRAAAPILLAAKEREIEMLRFGREMASRQCSEAHTALRVAEARLAALTEALEAQGHCPGCQESHL